MIVLDSSILVGIIRAEQDSDRFLDLLAAEDCAIGAPTLVEARAWCAMNLSGRTSEWLEILSMGRASPFFRSAEKWPTSHRKRSSSPAGRADTEPS
jgi:hypothetical protein